MKRLSMVEIPRRGLSQSLARSHYRRRWFSQTRGRVPSAPSIAKACRSLLTPPAPDWGWLSLRSPSSQRTKA